jgi:hypothetical protein
VSRLPKEKQKVLETAVLCLSRLVPRDSAEQILVRCVSHINKSIHLTNKNKHKNLSF